MKEIFSIGDLIELEAITFRKLNFNLCRNIFESAEREIAQYSIIYNLHKLEF